MPQHRYVFVGGLHRSGTSLVARMLGSLSGVSSIENSGMPENEGVYLQGAISHTALDGRPMHFATDPAQHHVEGGRHDRLEVKQRLEADWSPWFAEGNWRVEKSPVNLTRMRLYQQLFPRSQFVVVMRHPQAVAAAVSKWVEAPEEDHVSHWIAAHDLVWRDIEYLHAVLVLRYEEVVARPRAMRAALASFLGQKADDLVAEAIRDGNADYPDLGSLPREMTEALERFGYSDRGQTLPRPLLVRHPLRDIREAVIAAAS